MLPNTKTPSSASAPLRGHLPDNAFGRWLIPHHRERAAMASVLHRVRSATSPIAQATTALATRAGSLLDTISGCMLTRFRGRSFLLLSVERGHGVLHLRPISSSGRVGPTDIDAHVGTRIRLRRMEIGLSATQVAEVLGVSRQQLEKYERAVDTTSASRLYLIALALGVTVDYFFVGLKCNDSAERMDNHPQSPSIAGEIPPNRHEQSDEIDQFVASYWRIANVEQRTQVYKLVQALARIPLASLAGKAPD
jgi:transcriptional regulator with XRE-family HTH domain